MSGGVPENGSVPISSGVNIKQSLYLCVMVKHKDKIDDPLKLLLPGAIYDYFGLL